MEVIDFSAENVIAASEQSMVQGPNQQIALDYLRKWYEDQSSFFTSLKILQESNSEPAKFYSAAVLSNSIPEHWKDIQSNIELKNIKETLLSIAMQMEPNTMCHSTLIRTVVSIALFEWPEEWNSFSTSLLQPDPSQTPQFINSLNLLSEFVEGIDNSANITNQRRQNLINFFVDQLDVLQNRIAISLNATPDCIPYALKIYNYLLMWSPLQRVVNFETIQKISLVYLPNQLTLIPALKCLSTIFITRSDSVTSFRSYGPFLLHVLSTLAFPNLHPITTHIEVINFVIRFLHIYIPIFELIFISNQENIDQTIKMMIDDNVTELISTIQANNITFEQIHQELIHLIQIILSLDPSNIDESYWKFWYDILRRMSFETMHNLNVSPSLNFFKPFFNDIRQNLFASIKSGITEDGKCIYQAKDSISMLLIIDKNGTLEFLRSQPPSPQLCYCVGCLDSITERRTDISFTQSIIELFEFAKSCNDPEYIISLLFCLSHSSRLFIEIPEFMAQYIDIVIGYINEGNPLIIDAAVNSLLYLATFKPSIFKIRDSQIIEHLIENSEVYIKNLEKTAAIKILKVCCFLVSYVKSQENIEKLVQTLFEPVLAVIQNAEKSDRESIETVLDIISETSQCIIAPANNILSNYLSPSLVQLAQVMVPNRTFDNDIISRLLHSISSIQVSLQSFELIKESILNMSQLMLLRGYIEESFFDYFKDLCMCYQEMNDLYPYIFANFIIPSLQYEDPPLSSIFLMISKFYPSVIDLEWLVQISIPALSDLRSNVNDSCLIALSNYFYLSNPDQLKLTIDSVIAPLLTSIFQGISDSMHQQSYFRYVDFLQGLINIYTHLNTYNDNNFKQLLVNIMSQTMKEPQSGFFEQFVNYIIASQSSSYDFKNAFINLLITLRKLSPGDTNLFKVEPLRSSSIFKMLFDQMLNGKGAFVFSLPGMFELEIKPQQQNGDNQNK